MSAVLEIAGLHAGYAGVPAVRGLDLQVAAGEVVALLGANGAGKTTTLLTAAGILPVIDGDVLVLGRSIRGRRPHQIAHAGLVLVPEDRGLFFQLTARENLRLGRRHRGSRGAADVLSVFPALEALLSRRAGLLSGGEQQMLALARALVSEPRVLMVDELSLGLAPIVVEHLLPAVRRMALEDGIGVLLVEQHVPMALAVADRAYVLSRGQLTFEGSPDELLRRSELLESSYLGAALSGDPSVGEEPR
jgi:branched-chain amino acid transport system ATP-binding protein